jgi:electron transfer flavoprotein beta subunit
VRVLSLTDLAVDAGQAGLAGAATAVADFARRPPRAAGEIVSDEGDGGGKAAAFLAGRKFV